MTQAFPQKMVLMLLAIAMIAGETYSARGQSDQVRPYQSLNQVEKNGFIAAEARRLSVLMSGAEYQFSPRFELEIQNQVERYVSLFNKSQSGKSGDARLMFQRGEVVAPKIIEIFRRQGVSPLIGLYIPAIESAYVNIETPNSVGALGMFQFLPKTGQRFGLSRNDLLDVDKAADAGARYISHSIKRFGADRTKEALALLAYNRGENLVQQDLALLVSEGEPCSICVLTEERDKLDANFQSESVFYVPNFFAAAIIGENPQMFGLTTRPLSQLEVQR